jgi:outer membrane protein, multidrug efflux system
VLAQLPLGLPAELLANRPDVQQAEQAFRSAYELTNVARTYFYPALTLSASAGFAHSDVDRLFSPTSFIGAIIGGLTQPIINRGLNRQRLQVARADQQAALYQFRQTLLTAGQEVSNALYAYRAAGEKAEARTRQLEALAKAVEYTKELLRYTSNTNYVDVLTSEQSLLTARVSAVNDRLQQLQAVVALYRALGGGYR